MKELPLVHKKPHGDLHLLLPMKFGTQPRDTQLREAEQGLTWLCPHERLPHPLVGRLISSTRASTHTLCDNAGVSSVPHPLNVGWLPDLLQPQGWGQGKVSSEPRAPLSPGTPPAP